MSSIIDNMQSLAYSASVGLMLLQKHYSRTSSMKFLSTYGAKIIAPAFAGYSYHVIGLVGISLIDILIFTCAITTVLLIHILQPPFKEVHQVFEPAMKPDG
ncbi:MAG: hypothetical protein RMY16_05625 [Nostoc sp. DedQUE12b]|uniref:hypothetical protein n=1 Tax=Nostoc sp. DedQUE12b TaxID=3075398 RepID=UPI002AD58329|nr:hypothetical protein [Nostoc sp. DedQUE12b]MDZ8085066.1 hypothetical protein [Nostoc sp. DedQUE12b]